MALKTVLIKIFVDVLCLAAVWVCDIIVSRWKPFHRGFFCDDNSIRYPYHESTLSSKEFGAIFVCGPVILIIIVEAVRLRYKSRKAAAARDHNFGNPEPFTVGVVRIPGVVVEILRLLAFFVFGLGCAKLITDVTKVSVGRLRPNFIDVCQPFNDSSSCTPGVYYEHFECRTSDEKLLRDVRVSFPSGHASFSAFAMVFTVIYLQARMTWTGSRLARPLLQAAAVLAMWYTGLLRVTDNKHHWSDVLAGFAIGATTAVLMALYVTHLFENKNPGKKDRLLANHTEGPLTTPMTEAEMDGIVTSP